MEFLDPSFFPPLVHVLLSRFILESCVHTQGHSSKLRSLSGMLRRVLVGEPVYRIARENTLLFNSVRIITSPKGAKTHLTSLLAYYRRPWG